MIDSKVDEILKNAFRCADNAKAYYLAGSKLDRMGRRVSYVERMGGIIASYLKDNKAKIV